MNDPIVEEVRRVREEYAARFGYDWDAIFQDIKEQERKSGLKFVSYEQPPSRQSPTQLPSNGSVAADSDKNLSQSVEP